VGKRKAAKEREAAGGGAGHHGLPVVASALPASSASRTLHFGASFSLRILPVLGHFEPLLLSSLIL